MDRAPCAKKTPAAAVRLPGSWLMQRTKPLLRKKDIAAG